MRSSSRFITILTCLAPVSVSLGGELPRQFTLGRYLPDNVWVYAHGVSNPERAWIDQQWAEVFQALKDSGIDRDLTSMLLSLVPDRQSAEATIENITGLVKRVRWGDLIGREVAFGERLSHNGPMPDYMCLCRGKAGSAEGNLAALVAIARELAALNDKIKLTEGKMSGAEFWTLRPTDPKLEKLPIALHIFRKGDIIGIVLGTEGAKDILALMAEKSELRPIVEAARFKEALGQIESPEDSLVFFDGKIMLHSIGKIMTAVQEREAREWEEKARAADADEARACAEKAKAVRAEKDKAIHAIRKAIALLNVIDYTITTIETDGRRERSHQIVRFQPGKENSPIVRVFLDRKPFDPFDQYVPADATSFSVDGFMDVERMYRIVTDFVEKELPGGPEHCQAWNDLLKEIGFDPQRDLFSWWSGEMISVTLPAVVVTPMSSSDSVLMIRVKDSKLANQKIGAALDRASTFLQGKGQMAMITPARVNAEGFREITHPWIMTFMRPVVGVKDNWLFLGTSAAAINKCLDVAAGKAPSIARNERFQKEGLIPEGPVLSVSFTDMTNFGQEMAGVVTIIGTMGGLMTAMIPEVPGNGAESREMSQVKRVMQSIAGVILKLGPVLQKIDFYSSRAAMTTVDGNIARIESVTTYKPPAPEEKKTVTAAIPAA